MSDCFKLNIKKIYKFVEETMCYLFPCYFESVKSDLNLYLKHKKEKICNLYLKYISKEKLDTFVVELDLLKEKLISDLDFFLESDPAIASKEEVILTYPEFLAIFYYRLAHILYLLNIELIPRLISERVHSLTGIDIHPGAEIGVPFFIDHGTGIVIGQTSTIGKYVKMYHGVTLGALSLKGGRSLHNVKRHPTIKDYVTIYSGASILGGETIIGERVTIGSNVFIVNSILNDSKAVYCPNATVCVIKKE